MENNIPKPITLERQDFINKILELCDNTKLPFFCIEDIFKGLAKEVHQLAVKQYEQDKQNYEMQTGNRENALL